MLIGGNVAGFAILFCTYLRLDHHLCCNLHLFDATCCYDADAAAAANMNQLLSSPPRAFHVCDDAN